jgi:preprotein translocase subunit YajC
MMFALLQAQPAQPAWVSLLPIVGMGLLFYFLILRPQSKQRKEMEARLAKLKSGDEVLLGSGLYATIEKVDEKDAKILYLKLGNNIVKAKRQAVVALASESEPETKN